MSRLFRALEMLDSSEWVAALAVLAACAPGAELRGQCQYTITATIQGPECGIFGFPPTFGTALSDSGEVVGWYTACTIGTDEAFYWSEGTGFVTLDRPPGVFAAMASDISNEGTIVGTYRVTGIDFRGFIHDLKAGTWIEIPPLEGGQWTWAEAISTDGSTVVGQRTGGLGGGPTSPYQAYIYNVLNSRFTDLGVINGPNSWTNDIADAFVAGGTGGSSSSMPFRWSDERFELLGLPFDATSAGANGVNESGTMAGGARIRVKGFELPVVRPVVWPLNDPEILLPVLAGYAAGTVHAISDSGVLVGSCANSQSDERAVIFQSDQASDLEDALDEAFDGALIRAVDVNSRGQILVRGNNADQDKVAFVLTPLAQSSADLTGDCDVDTNDLSLLLNSWGLCDACDADLDGDGIVGPGDLAQLLSNWG